MDALEKRFIKYLIIILVCLFVLLAFWVRPQSGRFVMPDKEMINFQLDTATGAVYSYDMTNKKWVQIRPPIR